MYSNNAKYRKLKRFFFKKAFTVVCVRACMVSRSCLLLHYRERFHRNKKQASAARRPNRCSVGDGPKSAIFCFLLHGNNSFSARERKNANNFNHNQSFSVAQLSFYSSPHFGWKELSSLLCVAFPRQTSDSRCELSDRSEIIRRKKLCLAIETQWTKFNTTRTAFTSHSIPHSFHINDDISNAHIWAARKISRSLLFAAFLVTKIIAIF